MIIIQYIYTKNTDIVKDNNKKNSSILTLDYMK